MTSGAAVLVLLSLPAAGAAQGAVSGVVMDAGTGAPLAEVSVRVVGGTEPRVTDGDGRFRFAVLAWGAHVLESSRLGYATRTDTIRMATGENLRLEVRLAPVALDLPPLVVEVRSQKLESAGFFQRRARGMGVQLTRDEIASYNVDRLGDLFSRVPGLKRSIQSDGTSRIDTRGGKPPISRCDTQYFVNGVRSEVGATGVDMIQVQSIEGIEVYRGSSEVPPQFDTGRAMCGAVLIWTRGR